MVVEIMIVIIPHLQILVSSPLFFGCMLSEGRHFAATPISVETLETN